MKGYRKRKGSFFPTGNQYRVARLADREQAKTVLPQPSTSTASPELETVNQSGTSTAQTGRRHGVLCTMLTRKRLRRRILKNTSVSPSGNRIVNITKMIDMMNSLYKKHRLHSLYKKYRLRNRTQTSCQRLNLAVLKEVKQGLAWQYQFRCKSCAFVSDLYSLYQEIPIETQLKISQPRKFCTAAINQALSVVLMDTPIGNHAIRLILTALDIPPPSASHMQRQSNYVSELITNLNTEDMSLKRELLLEHNNLTGSSSPREITCSVDGRYNARSFHSSQKPGQASSQAYTVAIENMTNDQYIIGLAIENKLCWTGAWLKNRGYKISCPNGHAGCTSNVPYLAPHSERKMAYRIAEELSLEDFWVRTVTTDGDTKSWLGMEDFYQTLKTTWHVERQADPYHLAVRQLNKAKSSQFSLGMFPVSSRSRDARKRAVTAFSKDIKARSSSIIQQMSEQSQGEITKFIYKLPDIRRATVECYAGNCSRCPMDSLVCSGLSEGSWWLKSVYLSTHEITYLQMDENDKGLLETLLEMRLSEEAIKKVSSGTSTQKCEAFNRSTSATIRKEVNFSKNFEGRVHSAAHRINNTLGESLKEKLLFVTGTPLSSKTLEALGQISKRSEYLKKYRTNVMYKRRRVRNRAILEREYHLYREEQGHDEPEYLKGQADNLDHSYASPSLKSPRSCKRVKTAN